MQQAQFVADSFAREGTWSSPLTREANFDSSASSSQSLVLDLPCDQSLAKHDMDEPNSCHISAAFAGEEYLWGCKPPLAKDPLLLQQAISRSPQQQQQKTRAHLDMLKKIPSDLLTRAGPEEQALRCKLLKGATVVFFSAGYPGKKFIYRKAAKMGVKAVIIDSPDSWAKSLVEEEIIAKFVGVDMSMDTEAVFQAAFEAIRDLNNDESTGPADGICTFVELSVPMVSRLAEALGLPGLRPQAVDIARDKHLTRKTMATAGLPSIASMVVRDESQLAEAAKIVGFPAVLKPVAGAASLGVQKVDSEDELLSVYREVVSIMRGLVVSAGALERVVTSDSEPAKTVGADKVINTSVMLEEYLDGDEVDIDVLMSNGEARYAQVSDNGPTQEPYFGETWACLPSMLPEKQQNELRVMAIDSIRALGFTDGVFHVEGKYTSRGPRLIEVNARMGGGPVRKIHKHTFGVDLVVEQMFLAVGIPCNPCVPSAPRRSVAYSFCNAPRSGRIPDTKMFESFRCVEGVLWVAPLIKPGEYVYGPEEGMPTWIAEALVESDEGPEAARDLVLQVQEKVIQAYQNVASMQ